MASPCFTNELESQVKEIGNKLSLPPPSSIDELLDLLDKAEDILSYVAQAPSSSMQEALLPSMGALISHQLLRHSDVDVKLSVASCLSEITRITAPERPYNDELMKEIFQLSVMAFGKLSNLSGRCYTKALHILNSTAAVHSFLLMMDLEFDDLIAEMFQQFLSTIRSNHPDDVFPSMEKIMTKVIEESDEVPAELMSILLSSVKNENRIISPMSWGLGKKILSNCAGILKAYLPGMMQSAKLDPDNYAEVVASICQDAEHTEAEGFPTDAYAPKEIGHSVDGLSDSAVDHGMGGESSEPSLRNCHQSKKQTSASPRSLSPTETDEPERDAEVSKKRFRNRNSRLGVNMKNGAHSQENASRSADGPLKEKFRGTEGSKTKVSKGSREKEVAARTRVETMPALISTVVKNEEEVPGDAEGTIPSAEKVKDKIRKRAKATSSQKLVSPSATTSTKRGGDQLSGASKKKSAPPKVKAHKNKEYGEDLVGRRIKVWWPLDQMFYDGAVAAFDPSENKHTVLYADGDEEILNLHNEHWELVHEISPDRGENADQPCPATSSDKRRQKKKAKQKTISSAMQEPAKQKAVFSVKQEPVDFDESKDEATEIERSDIGQKPTVEPSPIKQPKHEKDQNISSSAKEDHMAAREELEDTVEAEEEGEESESRSGIKRQRLVEGEHLPHSDS